MVKSSALPATVDWRKHGKVTPVKNQGQCGSCWTFSTTGNIESVWAIAGHKLVSLSEQQLVDCVAETPPAGGCNGGWMGDAMNYVIKNKGIPTEKSYPYRGVKGSCRRFSTSIGAKIAGVYQLPHNPTTIAAYVAQHNPVSICVDATTWQHYSAGVISGHCGTTCNHAVLIVGYGRAKNVPYWIVKNSWGASWGDKGYVYVERGGQDECGIDDWAITSLI